MPMRIVKSLKKKLKIKLSLIQDRRRRRSGSLYPRYVPQHLSQIDLGEELTRVASVTSLHNHPPRVPSLTTRLSSSTERESSEELFFSAEQLGVFKNQRYLFPIKAGPQNVQLSELELREDSTLNGVVKVVNLAYDKTVFIKWTTDNWASCQETKAGYGYSSKHTTHDWFTFTLDVGKLRVRGYDGVCVELAVGYQVNGQEYWDNNSGENFQVLCN